MRMTLQKTNSKQEGLLTILRIILIAINRVEKLFYFNTQKCIIIDCCYNYNNYYLDNNYIIIIIIISSISGEKKLVRSVTLRLGAHAQRGLQ